MGERQARPARGAARPLPEPQRGRGPSLGPRLLDFGWNSRVDSKSTMIEDDEIRFRLQGLEEKTESLERRIRGIEAENARLRRVNEKLNAGVLRLVQRWFWEISDECWAEIHRRLKPGMRTLETGSGRSTTLFETAGCRHTALEHDRTWLAPHESLVLVPLTGDPPWYDWTPDGPFDLIFVDGPPGQVGRAGIMRVLRDCLHPGTIVILDDTHRRPDRELAERIAREFGLVPTTHRSRWLRGQFTVLEPPASLK